MSRMRAGDRSNPALLPEIRSAFRDLYILSSRAAQLGGYGEEVSEPQWRALIGRTGTARTVFDRVVSFDRDASAACRRLLLICEYMIDLHLEPRACPPALWREAGRLGREVYVYFDAGPKAAQDLPLNVPTDHAGAVIAVLQQSYLLARPPCPYRNPSWHVSTLPTGSSVQPLIDPLAGCGSAKARKSSIRCFHPIPGWRLPQ